MAEKRVTLETAENGFIITVTTEKKNQKGITDYITKRYVETSAIKAEKLMQEKMKLEKDQS